VLSRGDDDCAFTGLDAPTNECGQRVEQHTVILVKLSDVLAGGNFTSKNRRLAWRESEIAIHRFSFT
jgi:hypothetical protein